MKKIISTLFVIWACIFVTFTVADDSRSILRPVRVTNFVESEAISYPLALIIGELDNKELTEVTLERSLPDDVDEVASKKVKGQAHNGKFKVLAPMLVGDNKFVIRAGNESGDIRLRYVPDNNKNKIRAVYMTDSSGNTEFQSPCPDDPQNFKEKLSTAMLLMQCMTAERMHDLGYGRRTFNLEFENVDNHSGDAVVKVHLMRGAKTAQEYYDLPDGVWWQEVYREIEQNYPGNNAKYLVIPAYTRFDEKEQKTKGHTALGGGNLALFGSGNLFTWPDAVEDALEKMTDSTPIDASKFLDDSVGRTCVWGAASTCIGAALHELGHTLGLPHTTEPSDIMTRGFDKFYRVFLVREAPSAYTDYIGWSDFSADDVAEFAPVSASALVLHPFFTGKMSQTENELDTKSDDKPRINVFTDDTAGKVIAESKNGVGYVAIIENGDTKFFKAPTPEEFLRGEFPEKIEFSYSEIQEKIEGKKFEVRMLDSTGYGWDTVLSVEFN